MTESSPLPPWHRRLPWRFLIGLVEAGSMLAFAGTVLGFLGKYHWLLDLFAHFRGQYFAALAACALPFAFIRRRFTAGMCALGAVMNGVMLWPLFATPHLPSEGIPSASEGPTLRIVSYNLFFNNQRQVPTLEWLRTSGADIVFLCEVTPDWSAALQGLREIFPHQHHSPQVDPFGCALLSRQPWTRLEEKEFCDFRSPSIAARFRWRENEFLLLGMHPTPPYGRLGSNYRDTALANAADYLAAQPRGSQVILGDLNATRWSFPLRRLMASTGLRDSAEGFGWQPTWNLPSPLFQIPIDHVLTPVDWTVVNRLIGPDLGSDHRAAVIDVRPTRP